MDYFLLSFQVIFIAVAVAYYLNYRESEDRKFKAEEAKKNSLPNSECKRTDEKERGFKRKSL